MKKEYKMLRAIFIQSSLTDVVMEQKVKSFGNNFMFTGDLRYWFWRYVYMKDITAKTLTSKLIKAGFDNLSTVEVINTLNETKKIVEEMLKEAKGKIK